MIKKLTLLFLAAVFYATGNAQEVMIDTFSTRNFPGLNSVSMTPFSITYYVTTEKDKTYLHCRVINERLVDIMKFKYPVSKNTLIFGATFIDQGVMFILGDPSSRTRTILGLDQNNKTLFEKKEENIAPELLSASQPYYIFNCIPQSVVVIVPSNAKTGAVQLMRINDQHKELWHGEITPKNGVLKLTYAAINMENLFLIFKETVKEKTTYFVKTWNANSTVPENSIIIADGSDHLFPLFCYSTEGRTMIGGRYFPEGKTTKESSGLFGAMLSIDGSIIKKVKISNGSLSKFLPEATIAEINNGAQLVVVDNYYSEPGTINLVCELFQKTGSSQEAIVKIFDLIVIKTDESGQVISLDLLRGIPDHTIKVKGREAAMDDQSAIEWAYNKQLFHNQFVLGPNPRNYLCYKTMDTTGINFYAVAVDSVGVKGPGGAHIHNLTHLAGNDKVVGKNGVIDATVNDPGDLIGKWQTNNIVKSEIGINLTQYVITADKKLIIRMLPPEELR